uniref:(California timema) hypothetical protein n=1 Tax=Timema californicum TaxID=61474 RepID=A0A7R9P3X7_TIMCA|nr:unnamed protein product [Timema californicum]
MIGQIGPRVGSGSSWVMNGSVSGPGLSLIMNESLPDYKDTFVKFLHGNSRQCKICGKVVNNMKNHYLFHNPGCAPDSEREGHMFLKLPRKSGDSPTLHLCQLCGKVVRNKWHHYRFHNPEYFQCPLCHTVHNRKDHLKAHMKIKHNLEMNPML